MGKDFSDFWNHGAIHGNLYVILWIGYNGHLVTLLSYGRAWLTNVIMALPLNFLVVGPISFYLGKLQKPLPGEGVVENFDDDDELPTII